MHNRPNAVLAALQRAQRFLDVHATLLGSVDLTTVRKRLDEIVRSLIAHALDQGAGDTGARVETTRQRHLRIKLREEQMSAIAVIARRDLGVGRENAALLMPKASARGEAFLWGARDMLAVAAVHRDKLVACGMPATFVDDFRAAVRELSTSLNLREQHRSRRVIATKWIDIEAHHGRTVLRVLDSLVRQASRNDQGLLRSWQAARVIKRSTAEGATTAAG